MSKSVTLTPKVLKSLISEERKKLEEKSKSRTKESSDISFKTVEDVWAGGDNLVNKIDYVKALKIHEARLLRKARKVAKLRELLKRKILEEI